MLHDLLKDDGYVAHKRTAEERKEWRYRRTLLKICSKGPIDLKI